jgi:hypothetical protein
MLEQEVRAAHVDAEELIEVCLVGSRERSDFGNPGVYEKNADTAMLRLYQGLDQLLGGR